MPPMLAVGLVFEAPPESLICTSAAFAICFSLLGIVASSRRC
jgi:hypothetical protein